MASLIDKNLTDINQNDTALPKQTITQLIETQCLITPRNIAIVCGENSITYKQFNARADKIANILTKQIPEENRKIIGLYINNSIELIVYLYAILKMGGAYIPIDPNTPLERVGFMLDQAKASILITSKSLYQENLPDIKELIVEEIESQKNEDFNSLDVQSSINDIIYVLYTSGSTGRPKGAILTHYGVANLLDWYTKDYQFTVTDKNFVFSSFGFDLAQKNILGSLISGGELHIRDDNNFNPKKISNYIKSKKITLINCTPSAFYSILEHTTDIHNLSSLRNIFLGGEHINIARIEDVIKIYDKTKIINTYGPTECSDISCTYELSELDINEDKEIPIGKPIQNTKVLILDENLNILPKKITGEIFLAGAGVGIGYINNISLTNEKFIENPYRKYGRNWNTNLYKTGDLGYISDDNLIYCLGRVDDQVKIHGYRVELKEVDKCIMSCDVKQSISITIGQEEKRKIISYVVSDYILDDKKIIVQLRKLLPAYMIPDAVIQIEQFPINLHGKVDKEKLKNIEISSEKLSEENNLPKTYYEELICEIWARVLNKSKENIDTKESFIILGGYSILMARVALQVGKEIRKNVPFSIFIINSTIRDQAYALVNFLRKNKEFTYMHKSKLFCSPSLAQQRILFICELYPKIAIYNLPIRYKIHGSLDVNIIKNSLEKILIKHQALRTQLVKKNKNTIQKDSKKISINHVFDFIDLSENGIDEAEKNTDIEINRIANMPIYLYADALWKVSLFKTSENTYNLFMNFHHFIFDGWSWGVFKKDLENLYNSLINKKPIEYKNKVDTFSYISFLNNIEDDAKQIKYWKNKLYKYSELQLPYDIDFVNFKPFVGQRLSFIIPPEIHALVKKLAHVSENSQFNIYYTVFNLLLYKFDCGTDQTICVTSAYRPDISLEDAIGFFVNTFILRTKFKNKNKFLDLLKINKKVFFEAIENQDISFEKIIEAVNPKRNSAKNPISQILFVFQNASDRSLKLQNTSCEPYFINTNYSRFELEWQMWQEHDHIYLDIFYNHTLLSESLIHNFFTSYLDILQQVLENSDIIAEKISISNEKRVIKKKPNHNASKLTIIKLFEECVINNPNETAIICSNKNYSYQDINRLVCSFSHYLKLQGIKKGELIAIDHDISEITPVLYLAILKLGATFLPFDKKWPLNRKQHLLKDSQASVLITDIIDINLNYSGKIITIPFDLKNQPYIDPRSKLSKLPAYVIYTSGSTGSPKGVEISQNALAITYIRFKDYFKFSKDDVFTWLSSPAFDISLLEMLFPLTIGAKILIFDDNIIKNKQALAQSLMNSTATIVQGTPTFWNLLLGLGWKGSKKLKILCGGEPLDSNLSNKLIDNSLSAWNLYGPTEACIWTSAKLLVKNESIITIGTPFSHVKYYIKDDELFISSTSLANRYINDNFLTAEKFTNYNIDNAQSEKIYKTGDLVEYNQLSKEFIFIGRKDDQIKLKGYRINLTEISNQLLRYPNITKAQVIEYNELLYAFVTVENIQLFESALITKTWKNVFDSIYKNCDYSFEKNIFPGWISENTKKPFTSFEMSSWLDDIERKVRSINPKRILEIGAGLGQLAIRLAPHCEYYLATDASSEAIQKLNIALAEANYENIYLAICEANNIPKNHGSFDCVIINSVAQYFPSLDYFMQVLDSVNMILQNNGFILIADVRNYFSHDTDPSKYPENEMFFDKDFFIHLPKTVSWIEDIKVLEKNMELNNELSEKRYEVLIKKYKDNLRKKHKTVNLRKYVLEPRIAHDYSKIITFLEVNLPSYMIPDEIIILDKFPLTTNGKVDKSILIEKIIKEKNYSHNDIENKLLRIWKGILKIKEFDYNSKFFDIGGSSFSALSLLSSIEAKFLIKIELYEFYNNSSFNQLLNNIQLKLVNFDTSTNEFSAECVLLNEYDKKLPILCCIHPIDGEIGWYKKLAEKLGGTISVVAIRQGKANVNLSISDFAEQYIELLEKYSKNHEISILGWSFGALIAFELAVNARARRWNIRNLFLIDPPEIGYLHKNKNLENVIYDVYKNLTSSKNSSVDIKHCLNKVLSLLPNFNYNEEMEITNNRQSSILINLLNMITYYAKSSFFGAQLLIAEGKKSVEYVYAIEESWNKHLVTPLIVKLQKSHYEIIVSEKIISILKNIVQ